MAAELTRDQAYPRGVSKSINIIISPFLRMFQKACKTHNLILSVDSSKLLGNFLGSIRTGIVDNDNFPVDSAASRNVSLSFLYQTTSRTIMRTQIQTF